MVRSATQFPMVLPWFNHGIFFFFFFFFFLFSRLLLRRNRTLYGSGAPGKKCILCFPRDNPRHSRGNEWINK